ncbi:hypothetical protein LCGC14_0364970 [marine sediment metagenome]|uniref:Uncharacterized protein n=1 Tax=marine sediment metagenome TaxID=412755 RepID=A0A0F9T706_9ZZZZ
MINTLFNKVFGGLKFDVDGNIISPYPQSGIAKEKDFQRARNRKESLEIEWMNLKDKGSAKNWDKYQEYNEACKKYIEEFEKIYPPKDEDKILDEGLGIQ